MAHPSRLVKIAPLDLWSQPMLRLPGMRTLCRSDYLVVTPVERDRLVSEGYAVDYEEPIAVESEMPAAVIIDSIPDDHGVVDVAAVTIADDTPIDQGDFPEPPPEPIAVEPAPSLPNPPSRGRGRRKGSGR